MLKIICTLFFLINTFMVSAQVAKTTDEKVKESLKIINIPGFMKLGGSFSRSIYLFT